jgi:hypothetical protein
VRTRAAVVARRNSGRAADGTRSHPESREGTYTRRTRGHIEVEKAKAFTNGSVLNGAAFTGLCPAPTPPACLCSYIARRIEPIFLSLSELSSPPASSRGLQSTLDKGPDENGQEA